MCKCQAKRNNKCSKFETNDLHIYMKVSYLKQTLPSAYVSCTVITVESTIPEWPLDWTPSIIHI